MADKEQRLPHGDAAGVVEEAKCRERIVEAALRVQPHGELGNEGLGRLGSSAVADETAERLLLERDREEGDVVAWEEACEERGGEECNSKMSRPNPKNPPCQNADVA